MAKVLIIRLSSFGDVAMLVPVVYSVAAQYPQIKFHVLTRSAFAPLFDNMGFNVSAISFDLNNNGGGMRGLMKMITRLQSQGFTHVIDEHDVLRTKIIRWTMALTGKKTFCIDKGRSEKKKAILDKKIEVPLKHTVQRYLDTFIKAGFATDISFSNFFELADKDMYQLRHIVEDGKSGNWIGIAPFSKHDEKNYPIDKMEKVVAKLSEDSDNTIFLFGGSKHERKILDTWCAKYTNTKNLCGQLDLVKEMLLINYLDVMVSMDSANMHLASLVQVPVISIWGATHPNMGFYGFGQNPQNAIQIEMDCRPCSVYGEKECTRGDYACLNRISPDTVYDKIQEVLAAKE